MFQQLKHLYDFGPFCLDATAGILRRDENAVPLAPKTFDVLLVLVENAGRFMTAEDLRKAAWPDTHVDKSNVKVQIFSLREALSAAGDGGQYIENSPKRGYKLAGPVNERWEGGLEAKEGEGPARIPRVTTLSAQGHIKGWVRLRRELVVFLGCLILICSAIVVIRIRHRLRSARTNGAQTSSSRRSVAVLGFTNLSGGQDERWLSSLLPDELTTELAAGGQLHTIPEENVDRAKKDLSIPPAESYASDTLARVRQNLGADLVVTGSYAVIGQGTEKQVRVDARVQDARNGETVAVESQTGAKSQLFALVSQVGTRLRQDLGAQPLTPGEAQEAQAAMPSNPGAARLYAEGVARLHIRDGVVARDLLQKAVAAEPSYPLGHAALAEAWSALGFDEEARKEAKQAFELSGKLSREGQLTIEASYHVMSYHFEDAIQAYQALWKFFPDNLEYGLDLAKAQTSAGRSSDAFGTIEALKELPVPVRDDPRIDLAEVAAAESISEFKRELDSADRAIAKSRMEGARLMMARGLLARGSALTALEPPKETDQLYAAARETFSALGDRDGVAEALMKEGDSLRAQGRFIEARKTDEEALTAFRTIGDQRGVAASLMEIGIAVYHLDESSQEARKNFEEALNLSRRIGDKPDLAWALRHLDRFDEALEVYREIGDKARIATCLDDLAFVASRNGDLAGATAKFDEEIRLRRESGLKGELAFALCSSGDVLLFRGDLQRAKMRYQEALAGFRERGSQPLVAWALVDVGKVLYQEGDLPGSKKAYDEALALDVKMGRPGYVVADRLELALVSLEDGHAREAEPSAREAATYFRTEQPEVAQNEAYADAILARCLVEQGRVDDARAAATRALELGGRIHDRGMGFFVAINATRVLAETGTPADALKSLEATLAETRQHGFVDYEFETRLAIAEIRLKPDNAASRRGLVLLAKDARAKGFGLVARKAESAAGWQP